MTQKIHVTSKDPITARIVAEGLARLGHQVSHGDDMGATDDLIVPCDDLIPPGGGARLGAVLDAALVFVARVQSMPGMVTFAGLRLETGPCLLHKDGAVIHLTEKERDILLRLHQAGAAGVDRATLLEDVWGYQAGIETHTLETHIYRLRQKIEDDPAKPALLLTDQNGYVLAA